MATTLSYDHPRKSAFRLDIHGNQHNTDTPRLHVYSPKSGQEQQEGAKKNTDQWRSSLSLQRPNVQLSLWFFMPFEESCLKHKIAAEPWFLDTRCLVSASDPAISSRLESMAEEDFELVAATIHSTQKAHTKLFDLIAVSLIASHRLNFQFDAIQIRHVLRVGEVQFSKDHRSRFNTLSNWKKEIEKFGVLLDRHASEKLRNKGQRLVEAVYRTADRKDAFIQIHNEQLDASSEAKFWGNLVLAALGVSMVQEGIAMPVTWPTASGTNPFYQSLRKHRDMNSRAGPRSLLLPIQFSLAVSPILLLGNRHLSKKSIDRKFLVLAWRHLGNHKPEIIVRIEREIWTTVLKIANNFVNFRTDIQALGRTLDNILRDNPISDNDARYFERELIPYLGMDAPPPTEKAVLPSPVSPEAGASHIKSEPDASHTPLINEPPHITTGPDASAIPLPSPQSAPLIHPPGGQSPPPESSSRQSSPGPSHHPSIPPGDAPSHQSSPKSSPPILPQLNTPQSSRPTTPTTSPRQLPRTPQPASQATHAPRRSARRPASRVFRTAVASIGSPRTKNKRQFPSGNDGGPERKKLKMSHKVRLSTSMEMDETDEENIDSIPADYQKTIKVLLAQNRDWAPCFQYRYARDPPKTRAPKTATKKAADDDILQYPQNLLISIPPLTFNLVPLSERLHVGRWDIVLPSGETKTVSLYTHTEQSQHHVLNLMERIKGQVPAYLQDDGEGLYIKRLSYQEYLDTVERRGLGKILSEDRCVLVTDVPYKTRESFSVAMKATNRAPLSKVIVHDHSVDLGLSDHERHRQTTLRAFTEAAMRPEVQTLNALDFPGPINPTLPIVHTDLIHKQVYSATSGADRCREAPDLTEMEWSVATTAYAWHHPHMHTEGLGTMVTADFGETLWIVYKYLGDKYGSAPGEWGREFEEVIASDSYQVDYVVLRPGSALIMPGGCKHAVITLDSPSLFHGSHFYDIHCLSQHTLAHLTTSFLSNTTNTEHPRSCASFYLNMVTLLHDFLKDPESVPEGLRDDLPTVDKWESLCDILYVCILCQFLPLFLLEEGLDNSVLASAVARRVVNICESKVTLVERDEEKSVLDVYCSRVRYICAAALVINKHRQFSQEKMSQSKRLLKQTLGRLANDDPAIQIEDIRDIDLTFAKDFEVRVRDVAHPVKDGVEKMMGDPKAVRVDLRL